MALAVASDNHKEVPLLQFLDFGTIDFHSLRLGHDLDGFNYWRRLWSGAGFYLYDATYFLASANFASALFIDFFMVQYVTSGFLSFPLVCTRLYSSHSSQISFGMLITPRSSIIWWMCPHRSQ